MAKPNNMNPTFRTHAAFITPSSNGNWTWITWYHSNPNKHTAILAKAKELNATAWDFGQADHDTTRTTW